MGIKLLPSQLLLLSEVYFEQKKYQSSIEVAQEILELAKEEEVQTILEAYQFLARSYAAQAEYNKAYQMCRAQLEVQKNVQKKNSAEALAKMQTRFQLKEQQFENEKLREESAISKQELKLTKNVVDQQRTISGISILGLLITSGLLFYVFRLMKQIKATNKQLKQQSQDLRIAKENAESAAKASLNFCP